MDAHSGQGDIQAMNPQQQKATRPFISKPFAVLLVLVAIGAGMNALLKDRGASALPEGQRISDQLARVMEQPSGDVPAPMAMITLDTPGTGERGRLEQLAVRLCNETIVIQNEYVERFNGHMNTLDALIIQQDTLRRDAVAKAQQDMRNVGL